MLAHVESLGGPRIETNAPEEVRAAFCDPARLAIGGNSAGGNLAAVVTQLGIVPLRSQLLLFPATDARCGSASYEECRDGPWAHRREEPQVPRPLPLGRRGRAR